MADVEVINRLFLMLAAKLSGRLNEHDIDAVAPFVYANLEASCYYTVHQVKKSVSPSLATNNWFLQAGAGPDAVSPFTDGYAWERVTDLLLSITTGEDKLLLLALCQHGSWLGIAGANPAVPPSIGTPMRLQYAFQVDSILVDETITGAALVPDAPPQELYRVEDYSAATEFDWRHIQYVQDTVGINCAAHPTRLMAVVDVPPGTHTVEVVQRRVPNLRGKIDEDGDGVYAVVFSRRLAAIRIKGSSAHNGGVPTLAIGALDDADVLSEARLTTARLIALRNALNDVTDDMLERGALNNEHIPTVITYPKVTPLVPGADQSITSVYVGYANALGWTVVNDGLGNNLRTSGTIDMTGMTGVLVVIADVEVPSVADTITAENIEAIGILALRYRTIAGTTVMLGETEVYVNAHNPDPTAATAMAPIRTNMPLLWVVDIATLADRAIDYIEVIGATWDGSGAANAVTMTTRRGMLFSCLIKGATLS